jgi:hypothetical protein
LWDRKGEIESDLVRRRKQLHLGGGKMLEDVNCLCCENEGTDIQYILESNPHPFYGFRGLNNQMRIRFAVESWILEKWSCCTCRKNSTIIYYLIYYLL